MAYTKNIFVEDRLAYSSIQRKVFMSLMLITVSTKWTSPQVNALRLSFALRNRNFLSFRCPTSSKLLKITEECFTTPLPSEKGVMQEDSSTFYPLRAFIYLMNDL